MYEYHYIYIDTYTHHYSDKDDDNYLNFSFIIS